MATTRPTDKKTLRQTLLRERHALTEVDWQIKSHQLCQHLRQSDWFQSAQTVLVYKTVRREPDLSSLWQNHPTSRRWGLPRCDGSQLIWHRWNPQDPNQLQPGAYGILEPMSTLSTIAPAEVDLMLVPAVACDRQGFRLGYGGGFYDRLLSQPSWAVVRTVGIVFAFGLVKGWEPDPWDRPMQAVCTEQGFLVI
ncbi:MAG: 5-formyltetrahydrofolate cyclo-ligase [Thermosynechococcaceae cyanobacterium]